MARLIYIPIPSSGIVHFNTRDAGFIQIYEISGHVLMHRKIVEETNSLKSGLIPESTL